MRGFIVASLLVLGISVAGYWRRGDDISTWRVEDVDSVQVRMFASNLPFPEPVSSRDPQVIREFLNALRPLGKAPEHKCMPVGTLLVAQKTGRRIEVYILPGHDEKFYEYGGMKWPHFYRADRAKFVAAMKKLGVEKMPTVPGQLD